MIRYPFQPDILDAMPEALAEIYRNLELTLLKEISDRLKAVGELNEVTVQNIRALRSHGIQLDEIKKAIRNTAGMSRAELNKLLDDVVVRNQAYYTDLITLAKVTEPETLVDANDIAAIRRQTWSAMRNLTQSIGFFEVVGGRLTLLPPAKAYQWALDNAVMQVQSGTISYSQAIANATRQLADSGLKTVYYEPKEEGGNPQHYDQIDVAVRRAVLTGVNQICDKYTDQSMEYLGTPYVEVSAHSGARDKPYPNPWSSHKAWQGKVYYQSKNGERDPMGRFPDLVEVTGYGEVDGLCGINCRHKRYPFVPGVMERTYTDEELTNIDPPDFKYEGRTYTHYEATQIQRQIERTIRKLKRRVAAATTEEDAQAARIKSRRLTEKYHEFSKAAGLREQRERMNVYIVREENK